MVRFVGRIHLIEAPQLAGRENNRALNEEHVGGGQEEYARQ